MSENSNLSRKNIKCRVTDVTRKWHNFFKYILLAYIFELKFQNNKKLHNFVDIWHLFVAVIESLMFSWLVDVI